MADEEAADLTAMAEAAEAGDVQDVETGAEDAGVDAHGEDELADDVFNFTEEDGAEGEGESGEADGEDYKLDFGEDAGGIPEELHGGLGKIAQGLGLPGDKAGKLFAQGWKYANEEHAKVNRELGRELKREWGAEFDGKLKATKSFAVGLAKRAGLTVQQMAPMMSPYGVKLLNAMREMVQEGGRFAGGADKQARLTPEQQLDALYADPKNVKALIDPSDPNYAKLNERVNALMGLS